MVRRLLPLLGLLAVSGWAQTPSATDAPAAPPPAAGARPFWSHLTGLFGNDLPELDQPQAVKLVLRPHFGDLTRRGYMRMEAGVRWALNDHFELRSDLSTFFTHGLRRSSAGYGIGELKGGARYNFDDWPWRNYATSVDLNVTAPVGHPPRDMTDGFSHLNPTFVVQHLSEHNPKLTTFAGMGLDLIKKSTIPGTPGFNEPHDNSASVTAGGVYDVGQLKWTFTTTYSTTTLIGERSHQFLYVQPGMLWYVPRRYTFHSKSQFIVGLAARSTWGPDGVDFSLSSRLRVEITFRQVIDSIRLRASH